MVVPGQISSTKEFGDIVLRANADGSTVRLKDVARIELGAQSYATTARLNGKPATGMGVQLSPSGNALAAATAVKTRMAELEKYFPSGVSWTIPYDSSDFVKISIKQVAMTLLEAIALVFLVMFLFLQNFRYTIIPTIVVPVALLLVRRRRVVRSPRRRRGRWLGGLLSTLRLWRLGVVLGRSLGWCVNARALT